MRMPRKKPTKPPEGFIQPVADEATIKQYEPLEQAVIALILEQDRTANIAKKLRVEIKFPFKKNSKKNLDIPEGFPQTFKTDHPQVRSITAENVLQWLYSKGYSKYTPSALYKMRTGVVNNLTRLEKLVMMDSLFEIGDEYE